MCREVEYRFTVLAYIKNITYHDYGTVDPAEVLQVLARSTVPRSEVKCNVLLRRVYCCFGRFTVVLSGRQVGWIDRMDFVRGNVAVHRHIPRVRDFAGGRRTVMIPWQQIWLRRHLIHWRCRLISFTPRRPHRHSAMVKTQLKPYVSPLVVLCYCVVASWFLSNAA